MRWEAWVLLTAWLLFTLTAMYANMAREGSAANKTDRELAITSVLYLLVMVGQSYLVIRLGAS